MGIILVLRNDNAAEIRAAAAGGRLLPGAFVNSPRVCALTRLTQHFCGAGLRTSNLSSAATHHPLGLGWAGLPQPARLFKDPDLMRQQKVHQNQTKRSSKESLVECFHRRVKR